MESTLEADYLTLTDYKIIKLNIQIQLQYMVVRFTIWLNDSMLQNLML